MFKFMQITSCVPSTNFLYSWGYCNVQLTTVPVYSYFAKVHIKTVFRYDYK